MTPLGWAMGVATALTLLMMCAVSVYADSGLGALSGIAPTPVPIMAVPLSATAAAPPTPSPTLWNQPLSDTPPAESAAADDLADRPIDRSAETRLKNFGVQAGQNWLRDTLGFDINRYQIVWDAETESFVTLGELQMREHRGGGASDAASSPTAQASGASNCPLTRGLSVRLNQTQDLAHFMEGVHDVPFTLEIRGMFTILRALAAMDTRLEVPLSANDPWRATASMPVGLLGATRSAWWRGLGLGDSLALRSDISSRLGLNEAEAGFGTSWDPGWIGSWNLDYAWHLRYGQGYDESAQWLRLSRAF